METTKFKTTMKCAGCIAKATPFLNEALGEGKWKAEINDPSRLIVNDEIDQQKVIEAMEKAGYKAEKL